MDGVYPIAVFAHVAGAVTLGVAGGIEAVALARLRRAATPDEARSSASCPGASAGSPCSPSSRPASG